MGNSVALLGDSVFDNRAYTGGAPDVAGHLQALLPAPWRVGLLARDGTTTSDFAPQVGAVPEDASHLVISLGGNDCLLNSDLLDTPVRSTSEALRLFARRVGQFEIQYRAAIASALALGRETIACTIYHGNLPADEAEGARMGLAMFNDAILRVAFAHGMTVIDLRLVCTEPDDYANPIEPSGSGGRKIAKVIAQCVCDTDTSPRASRVFGAAP